ncbi:MAG: hypothetical protein FGF52_01555 [Candidatus Brockarchaeota archaeon]|nr:hypothetical protein [Candidatus Brockarchaeota archaeon]
MQDDASAKRAQEEFDLAFLLYISGKVSDAAKRLGAMTHYISDVSVYAQ